MSIFRGTGGSGNSTDDSIVSAVTEQAGIATTKAGEAATSASNANTSATNAATSATTASTKATEAASSATTASTKATEANTAKTGAETAKTAAEAARDTALVHANTANNTHVQTVSGIATEVQNLDSIKTDITGVNTIKSDVTTVAGISSNVTTVAADASDIGTVATNITNVNNVGDNIANVNSVAGNATNINTVAGDASDIGTVSSNISNVNTVAGISSDVTTVAGLESKMDTVIADASDIGAVANNIDDVTTVAGINSEVDTVAGISAKVTTVADNITDVQNADTNAANASASASQAANSATAASVSATTASTKATESHASALAASNSASTATTKATEAAGSATTATTKATEASTSATNAATSATTATTKASEAASSATAASGSATTATTKASEADASANSAASSATDASNAASTWTNYYSTYLGAADAPPTADVQGNALQTGAFYYDTGAGSNTVGLYVYNGSSWVYSTNYNNVTAPYSLAQDLATNGNDISFGDNAKAKFGASDDLQIYHDGTNSYVKDTGTGYLILGNSDAGTIIKNGSGQNLLTTTASEIRLGHEGNTKLATKSTGIDVTGTVNTDGLDVGTSTSGIINLLRPSTNYIRANQTGGSLVAGVRDNIRFCTGQASGDFLTNERMRIDTSGKVGIGTTSPDRILDIESSLPAVRFTDTSVSGLYHEIISGNGNNLEIKADGGNVGTSSAISFSVDGSEKMRIKHTGNVGIGTTNPASTLHVNGIITTTANPVIKKSVPVLEFRSPDGTSNGMNIKANLNDTNNYGFQFEDKDGNNRVVIDPDGDVSFYNDSDDTTPKFRWDASAERLGIGTSTPLRALHVNAGSIDAGVRVESTDANTFIEFKDSTTTSIPQLGGKANDLVFRTSDTEAVRINSSGRLGIGTTNPQSLLDLGVNNTAGDGLSFGSVNSELRRGNSGTNVQLSHWGNLSMIIDSDGNDTSRYFNIMHNTNESSTATELFRVQENGRVGIGTSSPNRPLTVDATPQTFGSTQSVLQLGDNRAMAAGVGGGVTFTGKATTGQTDSNTAFAAIHGEKANGTSGNTSGVMIFSTRNNGSNPAERMRIDSSGNVGIGTTNPSALLHLQGTHPIIRLTDSDTGADSLISASSSTGALSISADNHNELNNSFINFKTDGSERMRIDSSGNVGIGRTPTSHILETQGEIKLVSLGASEGIDAFNTNSVQWGIKSASATAGGVTFEVGNSEKMRIDASGNVLVGKTATAFGTAGSVSYATGLLTATVDGNACVQLNRLTSDGVIQTFGKDGTTVGSIGTTGGDMYVGTGDTGIRFDDATNHIRPCGVNGANLDAAIDIGDSTRRFKDLYLSGGIKGSTLTFSGNGSSEHARIDSSGNLLVGTTSQISSGKLSVAGGASANGITATTAATSGYTVASFQRTASDGQAVQFKRGAAEVGSISLTSSATAYNTSSDQRLKENIQDADDAGSKIDAIQVRQFDWKSDGSHQDYGVIAQELLEVAPEAVTEGETEDDMMSVDYSKLVPTLIKEIQTLRNRVAQLENN